MVISETFKTSKIEVPSELTSPHKLIRESKRICREKEVDHRYTCYTPRNFGGLSIRMTKENSDRAWRIMDTILKELEKHRHTIIIQEEYRKFHTFVQIDNEKVAFRLEENLKQIPHIPTKKEIEDKKLYDWNSWPKHDFVPSNSFSLVIESWIGNNLRKVWKDGKNSRIEDCLGDFITGLNLGAESLRKLHAEESVEKERRFIAAQKRQELKEQQALELKKVKILEDDLEAWKKSQVIRDYISVRRTKDITSECAEFLDWASKYADHLDPTNYTRIAILDEKFNMFDSYNY